MADGKRRGRPEFVPTDEQRERVQILRAQGMSQEAIASSLDIHKETLVRHFSVDLDVAVAKKTAEVMMARFRSAIGGSVPAQNKFLELAGAMPPRPKAQPKGPKPGKKEQAETEASAPPADAEWGNILQ